MTSTIIGLPDRYRPLDEVGPEEETPTGIIRCWRAKDRVLNRDVTVRVHTPAGSAAHAWIARALTAGGLANPALAMVYDASEGSEPAPAGTAPGDAAYVVNEWLEGETLADRLTRGPLPERDVRPMLRRLADAVAEAHRVGLALGGLTPQNVVLRPNGMVGVRAVPAASATMEDDIKALGELLEVCLTGTRPEDAGAPVSGPPDLVALARRARSAQPGQGLSSVAAMAALLAERPRSGTGSGGRGDEADGRRRRARDRKAEPPTGGRRAVDQPTRIATAPATEVDRERDEGEGAVAAAPAPTVAVPPGATEDRPRPLDPQARPPVPPTRPVPADDGAPPPPAPGRRGDTVAVTVPPAAAAAAPGVRDGRYDDSFGVLDDDPAEDDYVVDLDDGPATESDLEAPSARRRLMVVGLPVLALVVVVALGAWWFGARVLSVAGNYDDLEGSTPSASAPASSSAAEDEAPATGGPVEVAGATVFDPGGDGAPENNDQVPASFDGDPATAWPTLTYQGAPSFGNLKDGVGVVYDLGSEQTLAGATLRTTQPGSTIEIRAASGPEGSLDDWPVLAEGTLEESSDFTFEEPVDTRYVLVWITQLVPNDGGFQADLAEVTLVAAG